MRELKRNMARENLKKAGFNHVNRKKYQGENRRHTSYFSLHWREWIFK